MKKLVYVFFFFLAALLFFGDGKLHAVDSIGAAGLIGISITVLFYRKKQRDLPVKIVLIWIFFLAYTIIRSAFSDDIGYSIYTTNRFVEAAIVLYIFYCYITTESAVWFFKGSILFCLFSLVFSTFLLFFPSPAEYFGPMNLLYPTYGHNHIVDILIFGLPLAVAMWNKEKSIRSLFVLAAFLIGVAISLSRAAVLLVTMYLLCVWLRKTISVKKIVLHHAIFIAATILLVLSYIGVRTIMQTQKNSMFPQLTNKFPVSQDTRFEYWRQAAVAIRERPMFGSGPGTFYLQSLRLQKSNQSYSWYAHSFAIQIIVEFGIVGGILLGAVFLCTLKPLSNLLCKKEGHKKNMWVSIGFTESILLTLMYSFVEFNTEYLIVWLYVWTTVGVANAGIADTQPLKNEKKNALINRVFFGTCLFFVSIFYLWTLITALLPITNKTNSVFQCLPFIHKTNAQRYLYSEIQKNNKNLSQCVFLIFLFNAKDPEISAGIAEITRTHTSINPEPYYKNAFVNNPRNMKYFQNYATFLLETHRAGDFEKALKLLGSYVVPSDKRFQLELLTLSKESLSALPANSLLDYPSQQDDQHIYFSKLLYNLGVKSLWISPDRTRELWSLAISASPDIGYLYTELASLEFRIFHNDVRARAVLDVCKKSSFAWLHCSQVWSGLENLPKPGFFSENIRTTK